MRRWFVRGVRLLGMRFRGLVSSRREGSMQSERNRASTLSLHRRDTASRPNKSNQRARYLLVAASRCHRVKTRKKESEKSRPGMEQTKRTVPQNAGGSRTANLGKSSPQRCQKHQSTLQSTLRPLKESPANGLSRYDALAGKPRSPLYYA